MYKIKANVCPIFTHKILNKSIQRYNDIILFPFSKLLYFKVAEIPKKAQLLYLSNLISVYYDDRKRSHCMQIEIAHDMPLQNASSNIVPSEI